MTTKAINALTPKRARNNFMIGTPCDLLGGILFGRLSLGFEAIVTMYYHKCQTLFNYSQIVSRTRNRRRVLTHRTSTKNPCRLYAFFLEIPQRADIHVDKTSYVM
jgi:hypothetical protein